MNKEQTLEAIKVMQAWCDGQDVEVKHLYMADDWDPAPCPTWDFTELDYRIAPQKPSINWDHVSKEYNWLAVDRNGDAYIYADKPRISHNEWICDGCEVVPASFMASYKPGNVPWDESLVTRPGYEGE